MDKEELQERKEEEESRSQQLRFIYTPGRKVKLSSIITTFIEKIYMNRKRDESVV